MSKQAPLFVEEEPQEPAISGDAWSWNSHSYESTSKDVTSAQIAALTQEFLASGGAIQHVQTGVSALHLECETTTYRTATGNRQSFVRYVDRDMSQSAICQRRYKYAETVASAMLANGHSVADIAAAVGFSVSHVQSIINAMSEQP